MSARTYLGAAALACLLPSSAMAQTPSFPEPTVPTQAEPTFTATPTLVPLDASTLTAGVAVTALAAGHATRGGILMYSAGTICVDLLDTATTTLGGNVVCYPANTVINIPPTLGAISVASTTGGTLSGYGFR